MLINHNPKSYSKKYTLLFIIIILFSFSLIFPSLKNVKYFPEADEGYYLKYATYISTNGIGNFHELFKDYIENKNNWLYPSPLRIGYILLSAASMKIFGNTFLSLSLLSLVSYLAFLIVSFYFTRKYFDEKIAFLLTILLAFSPLNMAMARRALQDSTANLFYILSIWLFFDLLSKRSNLKYVLFVLIFSFTILVKEPALLLSPVFIIYILIHKYLLKNPIHIKDILAITVYPFAIVGLVYMSCAGDFSYVLNTVKTILISQKTNQFSILYGSGPWFRYLIDFMLLSPLVCILSIGFIFYCLTLKELDSRISYFLVIFVLVLFFFNLFDKSIRHVIILDMPMRLFAIFMLKNIFETKIPKYSAIITAAIVIIISVFDYINFNYLFIHQRIYDPVSFWLLRAEHFIPWR